MSRKIILLLAIIATLIFSNATSAQRTDPCSEDEEGPIMLPCDSRNLPPSCPLGISSPILAGVNDDIAPPFEPAFPSLYLAWIYPSTKDFDDLSLHGPFAHSFYLMIIPNAQICRASLLIRVCNNGSGMWEDDMFIIATTSVGIFSSFVPLISGNIWNMGEVGQCKNLVFPISGSTLKYVLYLNVIVEGNTAVDYMKLDLFY